MIFVFDLQVTTTTPPDAPRDALSEMDQKDATVGPQPDTPGRPSASLKKLEADNLTGQLCLVAVALLWGTYSPSLRYLYSLPGTVPALTWPLLPTQHPDCQSMRSRAMALHSR